jgi:hypothetical protein
MTWSLALRRTKISSFDPALLTVCTPYATQPRCVDLSAVCLGELLQVVGGEIYKQLEHDCDSGWKRPRSESPAGVFQNTRRALVLRPSHYSKPAARQ